MIRGKKGKRKKIQIAKINIGRGDITTIPQISKGQYGNSMDTLWQ